MSSSEPFVPDPDADPGWRGAFRGLPWALLPGLGIRRLQRIPDGLVAVRSLFLTFAAALVMIGVTVAVLNITSSLGEPGAPVDTFALGIAGYGILTLVAPRLIAQPLDGTSPEKLAGSYRTRFFLRVAFADSAALMGFVGFVITGNPVLYVLGLGFAAVGFARLAPTAANLRSDQQALNSAPSSLPLVATLRTTPPETSR